MCRKTMDIKKDHLKSDCLRRIESPSRFGLRLLRNSVHQDEALRHWRSAVVKSTIRKYLHKEKKRAHFAKLAQNAKETARMEETHRIRQKSSAAALLPLPPPGAMAPANTTQYLMGQFYEDLQQTNKVMSFQSEELGSPQDIDTTLDSYDACLSFQQRDFEEQFATLW